MPIRRALRLIAVSSSNCRALELPTSFMFTPDGIVLTYEEAPEPWFLLYISCSYLYRCCYRSSRYLFALLGTFSSLRDDQGLRADNRGLPVYVGGFSDSDGRAYDRCAFRILTITVSSRFTLLLHAFEHPQSNHGDASPTSSFPAFVISFGSGGGWLKSHVWLFPGAEPGAALLSSVGGGDPGEGKAKTSGAAGAKTLASTGVKGGGGAKRGTGKITAAMGSFKRVSSSAVSPMPVRPSVHPCRRRH